MTVEYTTHCNDCGHTFQFEDGDATTCDTCGQQRFHGTLRNETFCAILTEVQEAKSGDDHFKLFKAAWKKIIEDLPPCECGGTFGEDYPARCHKCHSTNVTRDENSALFHTYF